MQYKYRLSYERRGDISFIARETISYFVTSERSERGTKYDIVPRAIKLILPSLECDNLFITYLCLYLGQKSDYIFTQPRSQGLRGDTVTKTLVKFILSFQNFGKKIACAVRHNRIAIQLNTVVSHCACDFFPKILER